MRKDNWCLFDVWATQNNKLDYGEFIHACAHKHVVPLPALEFASKVGVILCAQVAHPQIGAKDAYTLFISENPLAVTPSQIHPSAQEKCGGCGGGSIR